MLTLLSKYLKIYTYTLIIIIYNDFYNIIKIFCLIEHVNVALGKYDFDKNSVSQRTNWFV